MAEIRFLKPAAGVKVRRSDNGQHVKPEGERLELNNYYRRRIASGDLVVTDEPKASKPAAADKGGKS